MAERRRTAVATRTALPREPKPMPAAQRKTLATEQFLKAVEAAPTEKDKAITAALETINERWAWDAEFRSSLRQKFAELRALGAGGGRTALGPMPTPIRTPGADRQSPLRQADPYEWAKDYGNHQLRAVVARATKPILSEAVDLILAREPALKAPKRSPNKAMVDFIVEHVAGPGY